jgi:hypothetical protein
MSTVFGLDHRWGRNFPYFASMGIALRMFWQDWLAQDSAENGPNIGFLVAAIEEGAITVKRSWVSFKII